MEERLRKNTPENQMLAADLRKEVEAQYLRQHEKKKKKIGGSSRRESEEVQSTSASRGTKRGRDMEVERVSHFAICLVSSTYILRFLYSESTTIILLRSLQLGLQSRCPQSCWSPSPTGPLLWNGQSSQSQGLLGVDRSRGARNRILVEDECMVAQQPSILGCL
jgi:hypothetical protein